MLYTIISEYDIFTRGEKPTRFMDIGKGKVEYTISGKNKVVKSLFSTDPRVYLDDRYTPGRHLQIERT
ncbi:MAG: YlzJ-like family protein [Oscillospiraceae bacterium]|nr:YlzJ-like family protein [Oscillospiraceae bacterium]